MAIRKNVNPIFAERLSNLLEMVKKGEIDNPHNIKTQRDLQRCLVEANHPISYTGLNNIIKGRNTLTQENAEYISELFPDISAAYLLGIDSKTQASEIKKLMTKKISDVINQSNQMFTAVASICELAGYSISKTHDEKNNAPFASGMIIEKDNKILTLDWYNANQLESYILDLVKLTVDTVMKQKGKDDGEQ